MNFPNFLNIIESRFPQLTIDLRPEWGAHVSEHRTLIRSALAKATRDPSAQDLENRPPRHISISHCLSLGGFLWDRFQNPVGLDIEETARLNHRVVARVSKSEELSAAQGHELQLWPAKEAAWKALSATPTISLINIYHWDLLESGLYRYQVSGFEGEGLVGEVDKWQIAVYLLPSSRS